MLRDGETPERIIRRFIKGVRNEGIVREYLQRTGFEKPSERRRRKHLRAISHKK